MNESFLVLALAALPAIANFIGGVLAEVSTVSPRLLSLALHLTAGIVLVVVGVELMPQVLVASQAWVVILAFPAGGRLPTRSD
jgi:ZIP family zinc transporter